MPQEIRKITEEKLQNSWILARENCIQILLKSFQDTNCDAFILALIGLLKSVTQHVVSEKSKHSTDVYQSMHFNQSKCLEVIIDFVLNIKENKVTTKREFLTTFSYNKIFPAEVLTFFYELFQATRMHFYFLAQVQPCCIQLKISTYLLQYLHGSQLALFEPHQPSSSNQFLLQASSVFIQNLIACKKEFDQVHNQLINKLILNIYEQFIETRSLAHLNVLIECLNSLYDEESMFYDENNILTGLLNRLNEAFLAGKCPFETPLNRDMTAAFINLMCIAYKSNMITNDLLIQVYQALLKVGN